MAVRCSSTSSHHHRISKANSGAMQRRQRASDAHADPSIVAAASGVAMTTSSDGGSLPLEDRLVAVTRAGIDRGWRLRLNVTCVQCENGKSISTIDSGAGGFTCSWARAL
jgi:hypothetical protein